jgi:glycerol uptake facilitator protein
MGIAVDERVPPGFAELIIGLTVAGMITMAGNVSGASLHPAWTFGPYVMNFILGGPDLWAFFPIYIVCIFARALLAVVIYDRI